MPTCQNCHHTWSYLETLKRSYDPNSGMVCPYCKQKQYPAPITQKITVFYIFSILIIMFLMNVTFRFHWTNVFIYMSFIPLTIVIYPFWMKLSNEEKLF